jgi:hypothetical protein
MPRKPKKSPPRPITDLLYTWMHRKRIVAEVARELGVHEQTLSAELRPHHPIAKLGANQLVPMFDALRKLGYGNELDGILNRFVQELKGQAAETAPADGDLTPHVLALYRSLSALPTGDTLLSSIKDRAELAGLSVLLQTEILPMVLRMDAMVSARLEAVPGKRKRKRRRVA